MRGEARPPGTVTGSSLHAYDFPDIQSTSSRGLRLWVNRPQFRQYRSTNYGSDDYTPFVTIKYTPNYCGGALPFSKWTAVLPNCLSFAMNDITRQYNDYQVRPNSGDTVYTLFNKLHNNLPRLYGKNISSSYYTSQEAVPVSSNTYRVAMRKAYVADVHDGHYWRESSNYLWANKMGALASEEIIDTDNPSDNFSAGWNPDYGYYTGPTIYFYVYK